MSVVFDLFIITVSNGVTFGSIVKHMEEDADHPDVQ
jgi:hypothetical protein